ncbi:MAG TPA: hypothetical protein VGB07_09165 [Blastocatellia bacterium]
MNLLIDENMPRSLAGELVALGFTVQDARDIGLSAIRMKRFFKSPAQPMPSSLLATAVLQKNETGHLNLRQGLFLSTCRIARRLTSSTRKSEIY